nr:hypothetical protein [Tanacetum cinerariifolium]
MVEKDVGVAPSDSINSIGDDVNVENSKDVKLDNEDNDRENDVEEEDNETESFMALKSSKGSSSSKNEGGTGRKNLYVRWKDDYDDNTYDDDVEGEDLTEEQLPFYDAYDIIFVIKLDVSYIWFSFGVKCILVVSCVFPF